MADGLAREDARTGEVAAQGLEHACPAAEVPTSQQVRAARHSAGLSQDKAARLVGLAHGVRWSEYESGRAPMDAARWELFLVKTGQHPAFGPRPGSARDGSAPAAQT